MCNLHNQLINSCFWIVLQYGNFQSGNSKQTLNRLWMIQEYDYLPTSLSRPRRTQKLLHLCVRAKFSKTSLLQAMGSTGHAWCYKAWCSAVISMQSKRGDPHHTWLHRETNEKLSFYHRKFLRGLRKKRGRPLNTYLGKLPKPLISLTLCRNILPSLRAMAWVWTSWVEK